jgi:capsular polysaccharide biosynthesis protein
MFPIEAPDTSLSEREVFDLRALFAVIKRRGWLIVLITVAFIVLSLINVMSAIPLYSSRTLVLLSQPRTALENERAPLLNSAQIDALVAGEIRLIDSDNYLLLIIRSKKIYLWPEYRRLLSDISDPGILPSGTDIQTQLPTVAEGRLLRALRSRLSVEREGATYLISFTALSEDANHAAQLVNAAARLYQYQATQRGRNEAAKLKNQIIVQVSQQRLGLLRTDNTMDSIFLKGINSIESQDKDIFLDRFKKIKFDRNLLEKKIGEFLVESQPSFTDLSGIEDTSADMYLPNEPRIRSRPWAAPRDLVNIAGEPVLQSFSVKRNALLMESENLLSDLEPMLVNDGKQRLLSEMRTALESAKLDTRVYKSLLLRMLDLELRSQLYVAGVTILTSGLIPLWPSFPKKKNAVYISAILGSALGLISALFLDFFSNSVTSRRQISEVKNFSEVFFLKANLRQIAQIFSTSSKNNWYKTKNEFWKFLEVLNESGKTVSGGDCVVTSFVSTEANRNLGLLARCAGGGLASQGFKVAVLDLDRDRSLNRSWLRKSILRLSQRFRKQGKPEIQYHRNLFFGVDEYYFQKLDPNLGIPLSPKNLDATIQVMRAAHDYVFVVCPYSYGNELNAAIAQQSDTITIVSSYGLSKISHIFSLSDWFSDKMKSNRRIYSAVFGAN